MGHNSNKNKRSHKDNGISLRVAVMAFQEGKVLCLCQYDYLRKEKRRHMAGKIALQQG